MAVFVGNFQELDHMMSYVRENLIKHGFHSNQSKKFEIAIEEALVNIIQHAYKSTNDQTLEITFRKSNDKRQQVDAVLTDQGMPFNPIKESSPPDISSDLADRKIGGLGIHFMKKMVDNIDYKRVGNCNILTLSKFCE